MYGSSYPHWQANELMVPERVHRRAARQAVLAQRRAALRDRRRRRCRRTVDSRGFEQEETTMTSTSPTTERKPAAERIAVRCVDSDVHPVPQRGELAQYIPEPWRSKYFLHAQDRRPDLLRRPRLRARLRDARRHLPRRRRVPRQRPGSGVQAADHGGRRRHRDPRARRLSGPLPRGEPRDVLRAERLAGQPLAGQPQQLARALARVDLRRDRGARGRRRARSRSWAGPPVHGPDPDQGRAAPVMGRPEVRPDLGGGHQARHHR